MFETTKEKSPLDDQASEIYAISGAASGIGRAVVDQLLLRPEVQILAFDSDRKALDAHFEGHLRVSRYATDVRDREALQASLKELSPSQPLKLAGLIASAGILRSNQFVSSPMDSWDEVIGVNLTGTYNFVETFAPSLQGSAQRPAQIVVLSSVLGRQGFPGFSAYSASKAGVEALVRCWAQGYAHRNILVNAVAPGWVETPMANEAFRELAAATGVDLSVVMKNSLRKGLLPRMSEPREIAEMIDFLCSHKQRSITGQCLAINNGTLLT